ncbi:unannotated protein [freshwater metagenome]|uniref:Unannotated protein n=1 Tax=freshwater metagenome TaxID=449393 RepID=A0A6J6D8Z3_9ZZZZ
MVLFSAETIPSVTVLAKPSGAPIATTRSPTFTFEESANAIGVNEIGASTLITAKSLIGSVPTIFAG